MRYAAWAALYEGSSDALYFNILIPRLIEEIALSGATQVDVPQMPAIQFQRRAVVHFAREACESRDAFDLIFIHADSGGRGLQQSLDQRAQAYCEQMHQECDWPPQCCVTVIPNHETEAWILADPNAVLEALGVTSSPRSLGLPSNAAEAERISDPKAVLQHAIASVRRTASRHGPENLFPAIAQRQSFYALRQSESFLRFEENLTIAMQQLRFVR